MQQPVALIGQQPVDQLQNTEKQSDKSIQKHVGQIVQQLVAQIPWGHNILIFSKSKDVTEAEFYIQQTIENNWSRDTLALRDINKPMGISEFQITENLPDNLKSSLPTIEEIEKEFKNLGE